MPIALSEIESGLRRGRQYPDHAGGPRGKGPIAELFRREGILIAGLSWRAIFLVNVPLGTLTFLLAHRYLPVDRQEPKTEGAGFDTMGTLLLALTLAAYALAMTIGRGSFGPLNIALLLAAVFGVGFFCPPSALLSQICG